MPMKQTKSAFLSKLAAKGQQAHEKHKADETDYGQINLPAGIEQGIAKLVECKFDVVKPGKTYAGEFFFYAAGVVVFPQEHNGLKVAGQRTSVMEMLCDTKNQEGVVTPFADHYAKVLNEFRKLGVDTVSITFDELETVAADIKEQGIYFRFRTWKGKKQTTGPYKNVEPRVNHDWNGACEYNEEEGDGDVVETVVEQPQAPAPKQLQPASPTSTEETAPAVQEEEVDMAALAALADSQEQGSEDAAAQLTDMALQAGMTEDSIRGANNWTEVVELIQTGGGEVTPEEPAPPAEPVKGQACKYAPIDPKTKKPGKLLDTVIVWVDKKAQTVNLKDLGDGKTIYKAVKWTSLQ